MMLALAAALVAAQPAAPQPPAMAPLSWLAGQWKGSGASFGSPGTADLAIAPALGGKFYELRYRVATTGARPFSFEGRAFYRPVGEAWQAQWFDSRGTTFAINGKVEGSALTSDWAGTTEKGQTVYSLREDGRLEVVDSVPGPDGKAKEFARYVYERVPPPKG